MSVTPYPIIDTNLISSTSPNTVYRYGPSNNSVLIQDRISGGVYSTRWGLFKFKTPINLVAANRFVYYFWCDSEYQFTNSTSRPNSPDPKEYKYSVTVYPIVTDYDPLTVTWNTIPSIGDVLFESYVQGTITNTVGVYTGIGEISKLKSVIDFAGVDLLFYGVLFKVFGWHEGAYRGYINASGPKALVWADYDIAFVHS